MNNNILEHVIKIANRAAAEVLKIYNKDYKISIKKDESLLTEADLISDKIIVGSLEKYNWPILSEETKDNFKDFGAERFWIVDSLDGTMDFVQKTGEFSIMIGLVEKGESILGVVNKPVTREVYYAEKSKGSFLNKGGMVKKNAVSKVNVLEEGRLVLSRNHFKPTDKLLAQRMKINKFKKSGSNGIKIGLIASGEADLFFNLTDKMGKWDSCAPEIILEEAGGRVTDVEGNRIDYSETNTKNKKGIVASNNFIHDKIIKYINT